VLDRLCDACESTRTGLVLAYRSIPAQVRERIGRGNAAVAFMRLGNAADAKEASEQIGTEHRFVLSQLTDTVGASVTDTSGWSYTSTVGTADSVSVSASTSQTTGQSRGRGHTSADAAPFGARTGSGSREQSASTGTGDSESVTGGISASTSWGWSTSTAIGANESLARTAQRSREFLVEPHQLQQLPPSALIVSYASAEGRQVVLADANPAILALPAVSALSLDEARQAPAAGSGAPAAGAQPGEPGPQQDRAGAWQAAAGLPADDDEGSPPRDPPPSSRPPPPAERARPGPPAPVSWRSTKGRPPPNIGPPPEPLDWRQDPGE
jgi:hypothetical protein